MIDIRTKAVVLPGYFEPFGNPPDLLWQLAGIVPTAILMTWFYLNTERSVLVAIAFHWSDNLTGELLGPSTAVDRIDLALSALLALAVVIAGFPRSRPCGHVLGRMI